MLFIANSSFDEAEELTFADAEWRAANEPRLSSLEATVADQASRLELAAGEKAKMEDEEVDLQGGGEGGRVGG